MGIKSTFRIVFKLLFIFLFSVTSVNKLSAATTYTWFGTIDTDWNNSGNWSPVGVPGVLDGVQFSPGVTNMPMLTSDVTITSMTVGNGFGNCSSSGLLPFTLVMNNYKMTIGTVTSSTSATGSLHIESCPASWFVGMNFVLSCSGVCNNSSFVVNGIIYGANYGDLFSSDVDVYFNLYNNCNPYFRLRALNKNLTIECIATTDPCMAFSGFSPNDTWNHIPPYGDPSQIIWYNSLDVCTVNGNFRFLNRTSKIVTPGWIGFTVFGNFYISNTGGGQIRTSERTRTTVIRTMPGSIITIPPDETLPQNGDMYLTAVRQFGTLPGLVMDLTTCPGGCITTPTGNAMLSIATGTFSGPVFVKTPSATFRVLRWTPTITSIYDNTTVNNQFLNDFNLTKTGYQNDYFVGSNVYLGNVNIVNMGTGTMNFGSKSSTYPQCNIAVCGSCTVGQLFGNLPSAPLYYDSYQAGDTIHGNLQLTQACGAGAINLMIANKVNVYYKDVDFKISSNMSVSGTMSFNGPVGTVVGQSLIVDDLCGTNPILTMNKLRMFQSIGSNNLNLIYNSTLPGHQKLMVIDSSTVLTLGKINTGQVITQLNGAYNGHVGSNNSYYIVNTIGGLRRTIPTSSTTGYLFPTGTSSSYFPISITGASASAPITVGMIPMVNSLYSGSPAFTPSGTVVGNLFINSVWTVNSTVPGLKAMIKGGWWDNSAFLTGFDPTIAARMITNDGNGWSCFDGVNYGPSTGTNPSWAYDYSTQTSSSIPGIYSVVTDGVSTSPGQSLCGQLITLTGLTASAINSGAWEVTSSPSAVTFITTTTIGNNTVMGLNTTGTYALLWYSTSYCGKSASVPVNIYKTGSGTISGFWQGNSQDWFACKNWDNGNIPTITTNVTIPGGKLFYPNSSVSGFIGNLSTPIQITDLTIQNGSSFILTTSSGNRLEINGNLNVQTGGTLSISSTDYVTMAGSTSLSTITGAGSISVGNFRINKTSGDVLLDRGLTMQSGSYALDMIKGVLRSYETTSTGPNVLVMNPGNTVTSVSDASYVDGWVRKVGNTPFVFPTGSSNGYKAIEISAPSSITDHFTAKYYAVDPTSYWDKNSKDVTLHHVSRMEYWILDRTGGTSAADVTLYWNLFSDVSYSAADYSAMRVSKWDGTTWIDLGNASTYPSADRNYGWVKAGTSAISFSPFTLATTIPANPLPLGLIMFDVKPVSEGAKIDWTLASTNNLVSFEVERGANIRDFKKIFTIKKDDIKVNYSLIDEEPLSGTSYYRLKTIDVNGETGYSQVVVYKSFFNDPELTFNVSPNPFNSRIKVRLSALSDKINVAIFDLTGMQLLNRNYNDQSEIMLDLESFPSGVYNIKITTPLTSYTEKLIKL